MPENILGQLGNRVQHALRAFTAKDQKGLKLAAETYRPNPAFAIEEAIRDVGTGEAVTSFLEAKGVPGIAQKTLIRPPSSQVGPLAETERAAILSASPMRGKYDTPIDRESAWERLRARADAAAAEAAKAETATAEAREFERARRFDGNIAPQEKPRRTSNSRSDSVTEVFAKSFARQLGSKSGQAMIRGVLGSLFGKR